MSRELGYTFTLGASLNSSFRGSFGAARTEIQGLAQGVRQLESSNMAKLGAGFESQRTKITGLGRDLRGAQTELAGLRERAQAAGGASGTLARQIAQAEQRVNGLSSGLQRASEEYRNQIARMRTAEGSISTLRRNYQGLAQDIERTRQRQQGLSANLAQRDALGRQRGDLQGRIMGTVGMGMAAAAPAALSIGFEDSMARVGALSNATREDLALLTDQARQLGRDTVFTASQAAEGMGYLAMAGFNTTQSMAAMPGMLELAAAGNTDLGRTADIASNILSGFKLKADEMGMASDVLAKTFTSSNTTLESLGETMKYVGPVAAAVGMSMQETAAATGLLGNVGIQGSQAGTALRAALLRLAAPPKMARDALAELTGASGPELDALAEQMEDAADASQTLTELGINTKDAAGNLRPMADILEELNAKTAEMGTGDKAEVFKKVFGTEASAAMIALADQAGKTIDDTGKQIVDSLGRPTTALRKYTEQIEQSGGTSARISKMMNDTTGGALRQMGSAFEDVGISVGNLFLPVIRSTANGLSGLSNKISWFVQKFPTLSKVVAYAGAGLVAFSVGSLALGYAVNVVGTGLNTARRAVLLMSGAQAVTAGTTQTLTMWQRAHNLATLSWSGVLGGARSRLLGLGTSLAAFAGIQSGATASTVFMTVAQKVWAAGSAICGGALRVLGMAVRFALGPVGLIITALTIGAGLIIDNWDTVGPYFKDLWNGITGTFQGAWDFIKDIVDKITGAVAWVGQKIDETPVLGSAKRGLGSAWDWAFGDDAEGDKAASQQPVAPTQPQTVGTTTPPQTQPQPVGTGAQAQTQPVGAAATLPATSTPANPATPPVQGMGSGAQLPQRADPQADAPPAKRPRGMSAEEQAIFAQDSQGGGDFSEFSAEEQALLAQLDTSSAGSAMPNMPTMPGMPGMPGMAATTVTIPMTFNVQGLDIENFKRLIKECSSEFESIARRAVETAQHNKMRTAHAQ